MEQFQENEEAEFEYEWLTRQDYEFKLLALLAVLADSHLAYRGTLADMCDFFGLKSGDSRNNGTIKSAINALETDGLLKKIIDGRTFTLTLSKKAEKHRRVIRIQKEWVMVAANYKKMPNKSESIGWDKLLRVWLFLLDRGNGFDDPITDKDIGKALGMKDGTVTTARNALRKDILAITVKKKYVGRNHCVGSEITPSAVITDYRPAP